MKKKSKTILKNQKVNILLPSTPQMSTGRGCPRGVMVKAMDYGIIVSSNSSRAITFTFGQIPLGKV